MRERQGSLSERERERLRERVSVGAISDTSCDKTLIHVFYLRLGYYDIY